MTNASNIARASSAYQASPLPARSNEVARRLAVLSLQLTQLERHPGALAQTCLPLGVPEIHAHLPMPGLAGGVLHEIAGATHGDRPAAFGFAVSLMAMAGHQRSGPAFLVATRRALSHFGRPYGHGLAQVGLDPGRLILIETRSDKDALWALEEVLRSDARPSVAAGAVEALLGLTESRRLNLAAARFGTPLFVLGAPGRTGTSAAATRWRIASALAGRDRFRALERPRWHIALERCRHGRPGTWLIEWDHAAYCFRLAEGVADRAPAAGAQLRQAG
jgi:protein ImuA